MFRVEKADPQLWSKSEGKITTEQGYTFTDSGLKDLLDSQKVPTSLIGIDNRFGTSTILDVLKTIRNPNISLVIDDDNKVTSALKPNREFISDDEFEEFLSKVTGFGFSQITLNSHESGELRARFSLNLQESISIFDDIFKRSAYITRRPQGGLDVSLDIERLVCSNGMMVAERSCTEHLKNSSISDKALLELFSTLSTFDVQDYMERAFSNNGKPYQASVAQYMGMRTTLASVTDKENAALSFPTDSIEEFYNSQGMDVLKFSRKDQAFLPSGLNYFDALNILTHGAKANQAQTLEQQVAVGSWASSREAKSLSFHNQITGQPYFSPSKIAALRGDTYIN